jgi:hypothetical protein
MRAKISRRVFIGSRFYIRRGAGGIGDMLREMGNALVIPRRTAEALLRAVDWLTEQEVDFQVTGDVAARFYGAQVKVREIELTVTASTLGRLGEGVAWQRDERWERLTLARDGVRLVASAGRCYEARRGRWIAVRADLRHNTWIDFAGRHIPFETRGPLMRRYERLGEDEPVRQMLAGSHCS